MMLSTPLLTIFKYSFLGLVITGAGFLIATTAVTMQYKSEKLEHLAYSAQSLPRNVSLSLNRNSLLCLIQPSNKPFCLMSSSKKRLKLLKNRHSSSTVREDTDNSTHITRPSHPLYLLMKDFVDVAKTVEVTPVLLEPSILFCMLSTLQKYSVISNNLQTKILQGSPNIVTFGAFDRDAAILTEESSIKRFSESGFEFSRSPSWFEQNGIVMDSSYSFSRQNLTVTVIAFFQRETFMWHPSPVEKDLQFHQLQFANSHAYENFTAIPFLLEDDRQSGFHLPSEVTHFLLQVQKSEFEECQPLLTTEDTPMLHQTLTYEQLNQRALIAIQELKTVLRPTLGTFWLWNETLLSWEESCNIFQRTSEFNIAVAVPVSAVPRRDLNLTFKGNEYLHEVEYHEWEDYLSEITLDCYGLLIHVTVVYEDHDSMWNYENNSTGIPFRNYYSKLRLCSASVLGHLVHKPCSKQATLGMI